VTDLRARLEAALEGAFTIERELGQGGMAKVFLAKDLRHGRQVAIKVFLPEVAAAFGSGRFLREIRTAANLSHPNILALYDSGETDGLFYYVMPYVEGESLAQRLARQGPLPIEQAISITRQVAAALHHAHARGIVHRDIKPGNILLSGDTAFVADFGIAQALEDGGEKLTSTGLAIGTPSYMSPEQSGGSGPLDGRADIYSLGCVLFEMLAGEPPYAGRSAQVILARHAIERIPTLSVVRTTVPAALEAAVQRALAKTPADRFATAEEFAAALAPERLSQAVPVPPPPRAKRLPHRWTFALGSFAGLGLVVLVALAPWSRSHPPPPAPDPDAVAVRPFRAAGAPDTAITRLAGELAGLFAQHFPGDGGPRAIADSSAAGLRLEGTLAAVNDQLVLSARLLKAGSAALIVSLEKVIAPRDSVTLLVDRAVGRLLAATAGEPPTYAATLAALPLPAIRAQLAGRQAYLRGEYDAAVLHYREVLRSDSSFAPAAFGLATAVMHVGSDSLLHHVIVGLRGLRRRLAPPELIYLAAFDSLDVPSSDRLKSLMAWNSAVDAAPDRAELWYELGERLFHDGPWTGAPDVLDRAKAAFRRAIALEPNFVPALGHLLDLAASDGNTADVRALGKRYLALDSTGDLADYYRWRTTTVLHDEKALRRLRKRLDSLSEPTLERIVNVSQLDGVALEDGTRAAEALWKRSGEWNSSRWRYTKRKEIALNRGRPSEAQAITRRRMADQQALRPRDHLSEIVDALYWDADTTLAAALVAEFAGAVDRHASGPADPGDPLYFDVCAITLWRVAHRDLARAPASIADLRRGQQKFEHLPPENSVQGSYLGACADVLEAQLAAATGAADLRARIAQLDSTARRSDAITWVLAAANLTAARLWEQVGDLDRALTATRRRLYITDLAEQRVLVALSSFLREEGRLAARKGDREGAIRAYTKYLALRAEPEAILAPQVARVKAALDSLERAKPRQ